MAKDHGGLGVLHVATHNKAPLIKNLHKFFNKLDLPWVHFFGTLTTLMRPLVAGWLGPSGGNAFSIEFLSLKLWLLALLEKAPPPYFGLIIGMILLSVTDFLSSTLLLSMKRFM